MRGCSRQSFENKGEPGNFSHVHSRLVPIRLLFTSPIPMGGGHTRGGGGETGGGDTHGGGDGGPSPLTHLVKTESVRTDKGVGVGREWRSLL